jgi:type VI secretion system secreted protein VgrG
MPTYEEADRPLKITTPLGPNLLLLTGFRGYEAISHPFSFELDLLAERDTSIRFDGILGRSVTIALRLLDGEIRHFNGLVKRFSEGARDESFVAYRAEVVPRLWLLKKKVRCRIFQHISVPDILEQVLSGLDVAYELLGRYYQRNYCVQYHESDFDFVSRLMEEEGIYYFFRHSDGGHRMVVTDLGNKHEPVPGQSSVVFEEIVGGLRPDMRIVGWEKTQELRSSKYTVWDHCFELPGQHLDESVETIDQVKAGKVAHKFDLSGEELEIYEYPGGYAKRFDSVGHNRAPRSDDMTHLFRDRRRTVRLRMEEEESVALQIAGQSNCGNFTAGHHFTLQRHFDGDGDYLLTRVEHEARLFGYRSGEETDFTYQNRFSCIPGELRYRPQRVTAKPVIAGVQTATVSCPSGEEIFCDKFGRVKVQFHWDREGKEDGDSSCWLRVAQAWAGKGWGAFFWPRAGHEVVVAFEEGDPDQPLIVGSVYNAANMPPYTLPEFDQYGGFRSASVRGSAHEDFNGIVFNDTKDCEHLSIHSENNMSFNSEFDKMFHAGRHKGERVAGAAVYTVGSPPGGGGSGGGGGSNEHNTIQKPPDVRVSPGLDCQIVWGENLLATIGANLTMGIGNNVTVTINPVGLAARSERFAGQPSMMAALASGLGGSADFTLGTSTTLVTEQSYDIHWGNTVKFRHSKHSLKVASHLLEALGVLSLLWSGLESYCQGDDHLQARMAVGFLAVVDAFLIAIVIATGKKKLGNWEDDAIRVGLLQACDYIKSSAVADLCKRAGEAALKSPGVLESMMGTLLTALAETST